MKIMLVWRTVPGRYKEAVEQFLATGGPVPEGGKTLARWHTPGSTLGWHLIEATDLTAVAHHVAEWAEVLELEVYPVIEDEAAGKAAQAVFGK